MEGLPVTTAELILKALAALGRIEELLDELPECPAGEQFRQETAQRRAACLASLRASEHLN
jgi:hypothetical protein